MLGYISSDTFKFLHGSVLVSKTGSIQISVEGFICKTYKIDSKELVVMRRGVYNEVRNLGIYLMRRMTGETLEKIGVEFGIDSYSTVSTVIEMVIKRIKRDQKFKNM